MRDAPSCRFWSFAREGLDDLLGLQGWPEFKLSVGVSVALPPTPEEPLLVPVLPAALPSLAPLPDDVPTPL